MDSSQSEMETFQPQIGTVSSKSKIVIPDIDTLEPEIIEIDGGYYRNLVPAKSIELKLEKAPETPYVEFNIEDDFCDGPVCKSGSNNSDNEELNEDYNNFNITSTRNGGFKLKFHVPKNYYGYIIGKRKCTIQDIEADTVTDIRIPKFGENDEIVIKSISSKKSVIDAYRGIQLIIAKARAKQEFTHFLSLPLASNIIKHRFKIFMENVLQNCEYISKNIFQVPEKLHLTLGMLVLNDITERKLAIDTLKQFNCDVLKEKHRPITVKVKGIEYMNDDPSEVSVLYAKVMPTDGTNRLQELADNAAKYMYKSDFDTGLMTKECENVKLHMTLMNTKFENSQFVDQSEMDSGEKKSFNATEILKNYGDFEFGTTVIEYLHLSQRYSVGADGYYWCTYAINI